jgi:hypothetical protein
MATGTGTGTPVTVSTAAGGDGNEYISYDEIKDELGITGTGDDSLLVGYAGWAGRIFDQLTRRHFYPLKATRYYDHPADDDRVLKLDEDLLQVVTFTTNNGDDTVLATNYYLMCGQAYNLTPYDRIALKRDGTQPVLLYSGTPQRANAVTGMWGYHEDWGNAWQDSNDTIQTTGGISAAATSITVADADGQDIYGLTPRFRVQRLLKIEDEYCYVTGRDTGNNTLTVRRGVNGTTAATHAKDTVIYIYRPMRDIIQVSLRLATWLYKLKDAPFEKQAFPGMGAVTIPARLPPDVEMVVARYRR